MPTPIRTIFYSWQSQLPNATNRRFIEEALEAAARSVREDAAIDARPEVEQDTTNVPGSPNIADTIRKKIDAAEVVICDISIVQGADGDGKRVRPTPNANVLIELGYAMKSLETMDRLVMVMNTAYGEISMLPFDLRQYRPTTYRLSQSDPEKAAIRGRLAADLEKTLRHVLLGPTRHARQDGEAAAFRTALETLAVEASRMDRHARELNVALQTSGSRSLGQHLPLMFRPAHLETAALAVLGKLDQNDPLHSALDVLRGSAAAADREAERRLSGGGDARLLLQLAQNVMNYAPTVARLVTFKLEQMG